MLIKNIRYIDRDFEPAVGDILVEEGLISGLGEGLGAQGLSFPQGSTVLPGFVDIHTHGGGGFDTCDGTQESLQGLSRYYASRGVTSFCPTTMTVSPRELEKCFCAVASCMGREEGAYIHGINMEGPYISQARKGAQCGEHIRKPDLTEFGRLQSICPVSLVDLAPEAEGALDFAKKASKSCVVSLAHTAADYSIASQALKSGFSHGTHLYNAMSGVASREPGVVGAVLDGDATAELICDGFHVSPAVLRLTFKLLGEDRGVVVSDSMRSAGCADGEYVLGGQTVYVKNGQARLADGTIAASTTNVFREFLNLIRFGVPFKTALKSCTINPARVVGVSDKTGSIQVGKRADLVVVDKDYNILAVYVKGKEIKIKH